MSLALFLLADTWILRIDETARSLGFQSVHVFLDFVVVYWLFKGINKKAEQIYQLIASWI